MIWEIVLILVVLVSEILVITENKNPVKALTWIMVLTLLPGVGLLLYFLIGKDFRSKKLISAENYARLLQARNAVGHDVTPEELEDDRYAKLAHMMETTNAVLPQSDNNVSLYTSFDAMFAALKRDILAAKHHVHIFSFILEDDQVGNDLVDLLAEKVRQGVSVRVMYDGAGNFAVRRSFYGRLRQQGIEVAGFLTFWHSVVTRDANCRNHRKIAIVDGLVGYTGGMNIADRYSKGLHFGIWRDTHVRIEGPAVGQMQTVFLTDWNFCTRQLLDEAVFFPDALPRTTADDAVPGVTCQVVSSGPMERWDSVMLGMVQIVAQSRRYLYWQSPYFVPTEAVLLALRNAALGGVDVRLMVPARPDRGVLTAWATRSYFNDVLEAGVKVYLYEKGYMHAKTLVCDGCFATVGSTNIDVRSLEQHFEVNAFFYNHEIAERMTSVFLADAQDCVQIDAEQWFRRPRWTRFWEAVARLFSPLL
ncbi:MAG: cardiolipin synthase [Bacteroidales bacterium]|nr:cardiolipin synthase [Bacteroidales bacterium]